MVFVSAFFAQLLLASAVLAAPRSGALESRVARRANRLGVPKRPGSGLVTALSNVTHPTEFSSNWAGAVFESASGTYKSVTGTFVVPSPTRPSGSSSGSFSASAWVGIDGDTCGTAILQTGIDFTISSSGVSYDAWYEYFPDFAHDFSGIPIKAGDTIVLTVTASSTRAGTAVITNQSTGKTVTQSLTSTATLCEQNAEWIVEDFEEGNSQVPFANFGKVTFTNAHATTNSGSTVTPAGAIIIDMEQNGQVLTSVATSSSSVTVTYV